MTGSVPLANEQFFGSIGRLVVSWAHLELWLDFAIGTIHEGYGGKTLQNEKPRSLGAKLTYLRRAVETLPGLRRYRKLVLKLAHDIEAESVMRHDMVHGAIISHPDSPSEAEMIRLLRKKTEPPAKKFKVTTNSILQAALRAQDLGKSAIEFLDGLLGIAPKKGN